MEKSLKQLENKLNLLHSLSNLLYGEENCACGGPLHIILDDGNIRDSDIEFCAEYINKSEWSSIKDLCSCILNMLLSLSPAQRLYWWEHRTVEEVASVAGKNVKLTENGYAVE